MKLLKKRLSRRLFLRGGVISSLAALGFVVGCGSGNIRMPGELGVRLGEEGDEDPLEGGEEPGGGSGGENGAETAAGGGAETSSSNLTSVWRLDPLYDIDGNYMGHLNQYKELQTEAASMLFRFDKSIHGRKKCAALRRLNWRCEQSFGYKPLLRKVHIQEDVWNIIANHSKSRVADFYSPRMRKQIFRRVNAYMQNIYRPNFEAWDPLSMAWSENELD